MIGALVRLARPHHWIKNAFVLVPVPFAVAAGAELYALRFAVGFAGFCLLASAAYVVNDILDAEADRLSPAKHHRPIAAGTIATPLAWAWAATLAAAGIAAAAFGGGRSALALALLYAGINLAYSIRLKHVALVDVFVLASGFLLRVLYGCALVAAEPSRWLLVCASSLALFLAFTKRRADLVAGVDPAHRPALAGYSAAFLEQSMAIMCGITLLAYALYSIEGEVFVHGRELAAMPFVAFALLHYLRIAYMHGEGGSPVDLALRSPTLQVCAVGWLVATVWSLGLF